MSSKKSLFDNAIAFSPVLAKAFGACGALLIQQIHYHCTSKTNYWEGFHWVYNTTQDWADRLMLWDERTVRRSLLALRKLGVVVVGCNNTHGYDKTLWYRIDYECLCSELCKRLPMWTFCPDAYGQNVRIDAVKMSAPIPKKEPKISTKTSYGKPKPLTVEEGAVMLPKNKPSGKAKGPSSTALVLAQALAAGNPKEKVGATMYKVWASSIPKFHPEIKFVGAFTMAQKAMITRLATGWGSPAEKALAHIIEHWVSFGKYLREVADVKSVPQVPVLEFLVKHSSMAMNYYLKQGSLQATAKTVSAKTVGSVVLSGKTSIKKVAAAPVPVAAPVVPSAPVPGDEPVSLEDILSFNPSES